METAVDMGGTEASIPRLARGWEVRGGSLSPAEGFLLSRIDGTTPWTVVREMGVMPPDEADRCLERWVKDGLVEVGGGPPPAAQARRPVDPEAAIEPDIDLSVELQREILAYESGLDRPYHELLDVTSDADTKAIKRAYFALSKKYHPDRYYRKELGGFRLRLENIFKKIVEAYELLSDPATRAELEKSLKAQQAQKAEQQKARPAPRPAAKPAAPKELTGRDHLDRLRRMFRIPAEVQSERKLRARQLFEAAGLSARQQRWLEASANYRLAIAFDPLEAEYKRGFADVQARVHEIRAIELLERADASQMDGAKQQEALQLLEEVAHHRPGDIGVIQRVGRLSLELNDLEKAREYAEMACDLEPETATHFAFLCRVLRKEGLVAKAREALAKAEAIDKSHPEVRAEARALLRPGRRR